MPTSSTVRLRGLLEWEQYLERQLYSDKVAEELEALMTIRLHRGSNQLPVLPNTPLR